jgi:hypothetical protein
MEASSLCAASSEEVCKNESVLKRGQLPSKGEGGDNQHTLTEDMVSDNLMAALVSSAKR